MQLASKQWRKRQAQRGASMVEFVLVTPMLMFLGLGIMQFGLVYHAKSVMNYATFEAARTGAVNHGQIDLMRTEFGYRMAPVFGGTGKLRDGVNAVVRSAVMAQDISATKIEILNPTAKSFNSHGASKDVVDSHGNARTVLAIPNSHLRSRQTNPLDDGLSVQDANLLKIRITYGYQMRLPFLDMEVPGIKWAMRSFMMQSDPDNWMFYIRGMLPIQSTATVRMQSEAWDTQVDPLAVRAFDALYTWTLEQLDAEPSSNPDDQNEQEEPVACDESGLPVNVQVEAHNLDECGSEYSVTVSAPLKQSAGTC